MGGCGIGRGQQRLLRPTFLEALPWQQKQNVAVLKQFCLLFAILDILPWGKESILQFN